MVASDAFADAWVTANRAAHSALVAALTGETGEGITIENDTVSINLGPIIQEVKQRLIDRGFDLASRIPNVNPSFVLVQSDYIAQARGAFNLLNAIGNWLPVSFCLAGDRGLCRQRPSPRTDRRRARPGWRDAGAGARVLPIPHDLPQCSSSRAY